MEQDRVGAGSGWPLSGRSGTRSGPGGSPPGRGGPPVPI